MSNYHKTFFLHGIGHTEAVILSDTRHKQTASIPRRPISFKFFPRRYSARCLFSSLFSAKNTLVVFFFFFRDIWLVWKGEDYLVEKSLLACTHAVAYWTEILVDWRSFVVFLEQTGVSDWKVSIGDYIKTCWAKVSGF